MLTKTRLSLNSVLNVKALVGAFNQEKALVEAFSMIVQLHRLIVYSTSSKLLGTGRPSTGWISTAAKNEEMSHFLLIGGKHTGKPETNQFNPRSSNLTTTWHLSEIN